MIGFLILLFLPPPFSSAAPLVSMDSLLERPMSVRVREFRKLEHTGVKFLEQVAFDRTASLQTRWRAVTTMGRLDPLAFRPALDKALNSSEWFMRNSALIALLMDERSRAVAWSMRALDDKALVVRTQAVNNLRELGAREAEPLLWAQISAPHNFRGKESLWIREHIARALASLASPGRVKSFQRLLVDEDERLHRWAVVGLENLTGYKLSSEGEPVETSRRKWLARLGVSEI